MMWWDNETFEAPDDVLLSSSSKHVITYMHLLFTVGLNTHCIGIIAYVNLQQWRLPTLDALSDQLGPLLCRALGFKLFS